MSQEILTQYYYRKSQTNVLEWNPARTNSSISDWIQIPEKIFHLKNKQTKAQVLSYSPGASKADKICCFDDPFPSVHLTNNATCSRNPVENIAYCQSPEASTAMSPSRSLEQTGEEMKIMCCARERKYSRTVQKERWRTKGGRKREKLQDRLWSWGKQEEKIQDKFSAQESNYSLISSVLKVIDSNKLRT